MFIEGIKPLEDPDTAFRPASLRILKGETRTLNGGCHNLYARYGAMYKSELPSEMKKKWHLSEIEAKALTALGPLGAIPDEFCQPCKPVRPGEAY